jgi:hypothetical protein
LALKRLYTYILLLIVIFNYLAISILSKPYSLFFILLSNLSTILIECISFIKHLIAFSVFLSYCKSFKSSYILYKANIITLITLAIILKELVILYLLIIKSKWETKT